MYRSCIFCSAALGSNESIERFPVGRSLAFDAEKGRLWAVCPRCARWNLAPIEERWEAIEDAERLFRDTRLRAQSENVGLAKLPDGSRLIRVGTAPSGELALWRYGRTLARRRRRHLLVAGASVVGAGAWASATLGMAAFAVAGVGLVSGARLASEWAWSAARERRVVYQTVCGGAAVRLRRRDLLTAHLAASGSGIELAIPTLAPRGTPAGGDDALVLRGGEARVALGRAIAAVNRAGAGPQLVAHAVQAVGRAGGAEEMLLSAARDRVLLNGSRHPVRFAPPGASRLQRAQHLAALAGSAHPVTALAVEMALHEETERRALAGELALLEAMWREAEEIAAIADRLPDLPAPEPPRMDAASR